MTASRGPACWPKVLFFVVKAPRTVPELARLTGSNENTIRSVLAQLDAEGLVSRSRRGSSAALWTWTPPG